MFRRLVVSPIMISLLAVTGAEAQQGLFAAGPVPLEIRSISQPRAVFRGDSTLVLYELSIGNPTANEVFLDRLTLTDPSDARIANYEGDGWNAILREVPGAPYASEGDFSRGVPIGPGERYLLYFWLEFDGRAAPATISHELSTRWSNDGESVTHVSSGPELAVDGTPIMIDAPVRGGVWLVGNGYAPLADHRRFFVADGDLMIPQRFGADFVKLARDGLNTVEGELSNEIFHAFGEPLYAVADGTIVSVSTDMEDNPAGSTPDGLLWEEMPGNHVILQIDDGVYAAYGHLTGSSIRVRPGQRVSRGDLIGSIGNSGNTSAPHLHFHLMDRPAFNSSDGVPFVFRSFERLVEGYRYRDDQRPLPDDGETYDASVPADGWVIRFPTPP